MKLSQLKGKRVAIWGLGVEGKATAEYLTEKCIPFTVLCSESELINKYNCDTRKVTPSLLNSFEVLIKSPGISPYSDMMKDVQTKMTSPTAIWFANEKHTKVIVITGTKGKSTTASLLAHILKFCKLSVNLVGNIGQALISSSSDFDYIVLEASSFQIYDGNITADIALFNNLFPEHLDWHKGERNYFNDKLRLLKTSEIKFINYLNKNLMDLTRETDVHYFNNTNGFHTENDCLYYKDQPIISISETNLLGVHNLQNIGAALSVCKEINLPLESCAEAVRTFQPLAHRLQNLGVIAGLTAINDSIATTPVATLAALDTVNRDNTILLIGGYDRGNDWSQFAEALAESPPGKLIISGQNRQAIYNHLRTLKADFVYNSCNSLKDAIKMAVEIANEGDTILLSPGAPSFDQFSSYLERGLFFEKELRKYEK